MYLIDSGQFRFRVESCPGFVLDPLQAMYGDLPPDHGREPVDFRVSLTCDSLLRRFLRPQISFHADQRSPFKPVPRSQAYPVLEWGMNWCIAAHDYTRLIVHAAVLERDGQALIFPATPGAGKSTLSVFLAFHGWNLYSDEMALIDFDTARVMPLFRPVCLKNRSIDLVRSWFPDAVMTGTARDTQKGDVAHVKAMPWQRFRTLEPVSIAGVVFPRYQPGMALNVRPVDEIDTFRQLCSHAFNYNIVGERGFNLIGRLAAQSRSFSIAYSDLSAVKDFLAGEFAP